MLYRLPDGSWIDPNTISQIYPDRKEAISRVMIVLTDSHRPIMCDSFEEAETLCDRIAREINDVLLGRATTEPAIQKQEKPLRRITVKRLPNGNFQATKEGDDDPCWAVGGNYCEAIGQLINEYHDDFGIEVEQED